MPKVLMIAFHYPPYHGSSGILRTWNYSRYLPLHGWQPLVLTASQFAYGPQSTRLDNGLEAPPGVKVWRAPALDSGRHLAISGRYPGWLALPDRWVTWFPGAVATALWIIARYRPQAIWSTFPIATAHLIAGTVKRVTGVPWIADFRDSMTEDNYPADVRQRNVYRRIEGRAIRSADASIFTTDGTKDMYRARYSGSTHAAMHVIPNGYDEDVFERVESKAVGSAAKSSLQKIRILHSGIVYPSERDPRPFLEALSELKRRGQVDSETIEIVFRDSGHDELLGEWVAQAGVADIVRLEPPIPYERAIEEMLNADALLLMQAANSNHQIPAKLYEYLRSGKPILAATDPAGDTARVLQSLGVDSIVNIADVSDISGSLPRFLTKVRAHEAPMADPTSIQRFSRRNQAAALAGLLHKMAN